MSAIVEGQSETPKTEVEGDIDINAMFDLSKKKKKKSKKSENKTETAATEKTEAVAVDPPTYTYALLLDRVVNIIVQNNPELTEKRRNTIKPPQLIRVGTKKTLWVNFDEICKMMHRQSDHVFQYMLAELGTEGSIDGQQRLVIKGKFIPKYIEKLLTKYIIEYVTCQMCRSFNTTLTKDSVSRLHFVHCQDCGSSRSVAPIKSGYHMQTKADRRAIRNAV